MLSNVLCNVQNFVFIWGMERSCMCKKQLENNAKQCVFRCSLVSLYTTLTCCRKSKV